MRRSVLTLICLLLLCTSLLYLAACSDNSALNAVSPPSSGAGGSAPTDTGEGVIIHQRTERELISDMINCYRTYQDAAAPQVDALLTELRSRDEGLGARWQRVMEHWRYTNDQLALSYGGLPEEVADGDDLCLVVLGFQLNPDGTMQEELIGRLRTALACAESHGNALLLCTGGGTAYGRPEATEAEEMAKWLIESGVDEGRILTENASRTTAENAMLSYKLLREKQPQISRIAIVTSDYHVSWGSLLFGAQCILAADDPSYPGMTVVANAAYDTGRGTVSTLTSQASGLQELADKHIAGGQD